MPPSRPRRTAALNSEERTAATAPAVARTRKYVGKKADLDKEAFREEFHNVSSIVDVFSIVASETNANSRAALCGSNNGSLEKATAHVIEIENQRRRRINSQQGNQELQLIDTQNLQNYSAARLKEMMFQLPTLPSPLPQDFSRIDFILDHLDYLKKTIHHEWATSVEKMIDHYFDPVNNILLVPSPGAANLTTEQRTIGLLADYCIVYWDDEKHATSNMNAGKKEILSFLGFVTDRNRHRHAKKAAELKEFKVVHGHCHPTISQHPTLFSWLRNIRCNSVSLPVDIENELSEIGWRRNQDPVKERAHVETVENDKQMIAIYEEFEKRNGRTVPWPARVGKVEIKRLYVWVESVRARLKEDPNQLDAEVLRRLEKLGFLTETITHSGPFRSEHRHFELVDQKRKELGHFPPGPVPWDGIDEVDSNQDKRRADRLLFGKFKNGRRMIIVEFDEAGHFDRSRESEQRKVYYQCTRYLQDEEYKVRDIHVIRINGGYDPFPCPRQAKQHAVMIHSIMNLPFTGEQSVTVHMLDFDEEHIHVQAYQARIMPKCGKYRPKRAKKEDQWETHPIYDTVKLYWTPKAKSNAGE